MTYSTVIDLFRKLSARTGLHATPHMFRHYLPSLTMSSDVKGSWRSFNNCGP
jgi:hypothetical protein